MDDIAAAVPDASRPPATPTAGAEAGDQAADSPSANPLRELGYLRTFDLEWTRPKDDVLRMLRISLPQGADRKLMDVAAEVRGGVGASSAIADVGRQQEIVLGPLQTGVADEDRLVPVVEGEANRAAADRAAVDALITEDDVRPLAEKKADVTAAHEAQVRDVVVAG